MGKWLDKDGLIDLKTRIKTKVDTKVDKYTEESAGKFLQTDNNGNAVWGTAASPSAVAEATEQWLDDHVSGGSTIAVDDSLTVEGAAADAKATGALVKSAASRPTDSTNRLWINESSETEYQVPTYSEFSDLKSAIDSSFDNGIRSYRPTANGSYAKAGPTNNTANRIRTELIKVSLNDEIVIKNGSLVHACAAWNGSVSSGNNVRNDGSWNSSDETITSTIDGYYLIAFAKQDTTQALSPSDFDGEITVTNTIMYKNAVNIENLKKTIYDGYFDEAPTIRGSYSANGIYTSTTRIITNYIPVHVGDKIVIDNGTLVHACAAWNGTVSSANCVRNDNSWNAINETIISAVDGYYVVAFAKQNTSQTITPSEFDGHIHVYDSYFLRYKNPEYEIARIQTPFILDPGELIVKPSVGYRNNQIQSENRVNTKFGIFKNGNDFCITYAENVDGTNYDSPNLTDSGMMEYKYKFFHLENNTESNVSRGNVSKKGGTYIDRDGNSQTIPGGVSFGSSVNNRLFVSFAFMNTNINAVDYKPCSCAVTVSESGVTFGDLHELNLVIDGVSGEFNVERMGDWMYSFYTSNPPYYDSDGYRWFIPVSSGFAYLTSSDGITWTLQNICKTPYQPYKEVGMSKIDNNLLLFAARAYNEDNTSDGFNIFVGLYQISTNKIIRHYRIPSGSAKPLLLNCGAWLASDNILGITDPTLTYAVFYKVIYRDTIEFVKWFEIYHNATYYMNILQSTIEDTDFTEMYIVGNNGQISNHSSAFLRLAFPATGARDTRDIPFELR